MANPLFHTKKRKPIEMPIPRAPLADTHGHLTAFRRITPAEAVARAALAGVRLLSVPVDPAEDVMDVQEFCSWFGRVRDEAAGLLASWASAGMVPPAFDNWGVPQLVDNLHFLAGVHPYGAQRFMHDSGIRRRLEAMLDDERCVGVGEFGLDVGPWSDLSLEEQVPAMRAHLRIAHERNLPVELHLRDGEADGPQATAAHDRALEVLREEGVPEHGCVLHCYTSGPEVMAPFVEMGCFVAFGGAVTFARSVDIRAAAVACPEEQLLVETDCPYMAPVPLRGQECEPAMVAFSAACVAAEREQSDVARAERTYAALWHNACNLFGLS